MVCVQHAGNTVKSEPIKLIFIHPESKIAQQESEHFMVTVVEQPAVPEFMSSFAAFMEITTEIVNQDEAAELADDLEFQQLRKQNAAKWLKRKAILENDKQQILQGNITNPKQPRNSPAAVS